MLYNPSGFMICETYNNSEFPVLQTICYDELFKEIVDKNQAKIFFSNLITPLNGSGK